ncbi:MAG: sigma-70 family RNA polymerase sigma factor [Sphingobium sp.]
MLDETKALRVYQEQRTLLLNCAQRILGDPMRAEDIVHDAWIAACDRADRQDVREFGAYLYLTVRNMAIDALRRGERYQAIAGGNYEAAAATVADSAPSADAKIEGEQELERFREALALLPERQRIAVEMHRIGNMKLHEIAGRFGISTAYAHQLVSKGLAACAKYLKEGR